MSSKKKINPRRKPATQADVNRAKDEAVHVAIQNAWTLFFTVLRDKENYDLEGLRRVWSEIEDLSDSLAQGYCTFSDLKYALKKEEGVVMSE